MNPKKLYEVMVNPMVGGVSQCPLRKAEEDCYGLLV